MSENLLDGIEIDDIVLHFFSQEYPVDNFDLYHYVHEIKGNIVFSALDDEGELFEVKIGAFTAKYLAIATAIDNKFPVDEVFNYSQSIMDLYEVGFDYDFDEPNESIFKLLGEDILCGGRDVLYIDHIGILPQYRGYNIGVVALLGLIERLCSSVSIVAIEPYPLDFTETEMENYERYAPHSEINEKDAIKSIKKLEKYYSKAGFKKLGNSKFMLLSPIYKLPNKYKLLKKFKSN